MCSIILQQIQVNEIGREFAGSDLFPFLKIAVTKALDQSDGTVLQSYDCWKMKESQQETDCEVSFRTLAGISSGPHAFWDSIETDLGIWKLNKPHTAFTCRVNKVSTVLALFW